MSQSFDEWFLGVKDNFDEMSANAGWYARQKEIDELEAKVNKLHAVVGACAWAEMFKDEMPKIKGKADKQWDDIQKTTWDPNVIRRPDEGVPAYAPPSVEPCEAEEIQDEDDEPTRNT